MSILAFVSKDYKPHIDAIKENWRIANDPDYFKPDGIQAFYGEQGSGKTITLIYFLHRVRRAYPRALVVSNIVLKDMQAIEFNGNAATLQAIMAQGFDTTKYYIFYQSKLDYELVNRYVKNGDFGVILVTDEYQNYFSNQDSRNVPPWVIEQAAQNRKQRRLHLVTSQDYDQINKQTRRRSTLAFKCRSYALPFNLSRGAILTIYWAFNAKKLDFDNNGRQNSVKPLKMGFYFQSQKLRDSYDTKQVVFTGDENPNAYQQFNQQVNIKLPVVKKSKFRR